MQRRCGVNRIWTAARRRPTGRTVKDIQTTQKRRVRKKRWCHPNLRTNRFEISDKSFCGLYTKNFLAFATPLQVPRKTFWRLRESRKSLEKLFGVCGSPASLSRNFLVFAGVPQVSRETFWRLREPRKSHGKCFGVCGSPASASDNFLVFAGVLQAFPKTFWPWRGFRRNC